MRKDILRLIVPALIIAGFTLQSCGNIDIVKRRYRPGFHVDVTKKKHKNVEVAESSNIERQNVEGVEPNPAVLPSREKAQKPIDSFLESASASSVSEPKPKKLTGKRVNEFMMTPYLNIKRQKVNSELKRAVFNQEEDKYGWSVVSFISTGLGVVALALLITGIVLLAGAILGSGFLFWWLFLVIGLLFGIGAMVTGIIGMRQTGSGERKGRGFAIAGMVAGILSLAGALIALFWGLIFSIITGFSEDL